VYSEDVHYRKAEGFDSVVNGGAGAFWVLGLTIASAPVQGKKRLKTTSACPVASAKRN
jgi:hypothetical protein